MVAHSTYPRARLKKRLYREGIKRPICEICSQGEIWRGKTMAMILDHINGVADDHRLENLRIVCPNCAATLDTHCGRKNRQRPVERACRMCGETFFGRDSRQDFCSQSCGGKSIGDQNRRDQWGKPKIAARRVERPPFEALVEEVRRNGWSATGRKYGVSDNAVRKWVRQYYNEMERAELDRRESA